MDTTATAIPATAKRNLNNHTPAKSGKPPQISHTGPRHPPIPTPAMFSLFRKRLSLTRHCPAGWDTHTHILPGVDDGAKDMESAMDIIYAQMQAGLSGAICTPHIMARYPSNTPTALRERFKTFRQAAADTLQRHPGKTRNAATPGDAFALHLAAEYMLDDLFPQHLCHPETLLLHPGDTPPGNGSAPPHLLIELPQYLLPPGWADTLQAIQALGITPLLAHPERYHRLLSLHDLHDLHQQGIRFQGNLGSLTGFYGRRTQALAQQLHRENLYTCWGTDSHSAEMFTSIPLHP